MLLNRTVVTASLAAEPSALEMREWLADTHLLENEESLNDVQIERHYKVFSRLTVGDFTWRNINSYYRELLALETSFAADYNDIGYVPDFLFRM